MSYSNLTKKIFLTVTAATTAFAIDFVTKWLTVNTVMKPPRVIEIAPFLNFRLGYNTGVSFGMFQDIFSAYPLVLAGLSMAIVIGILVWAVRTTKLTETFALGLVAGGAIGNIVDRVLHGAVTDFLDIYVGELIIGWFDRVSNFRATLLPDSRSMATKEDHENQYAIQTTGAFVFECAKS